MTTQTLKKPTVVAHPNPVDLEAVIETLRAALSSLTWLEKSFGRAKEVARTAPDGRGVERQPMAYTSGKEYYPVLPNDSLKAYSFFRVSGPRTIDNYAPNVPQHYASAPVDLIVWANLKKVDKTKDYIFTEELIRDVMTVLNLNPDVQEVVRVWDDRVEDIFRGYSLEPAHRDLLMYPYQAFRVEMNLRFRVQCLSS